MLLVPLISNTTFGDQYVQSLNRVKGACARRCGMVQEKATDEERGGEYEGAVGERGQV